MCIGPDARRGAAVLQCTRDWLAIPWGYGDIWEQPPSPLDGDGGWSVLICLGLATSLRCRPIPPYLKATFLQHLSYLWVPWVFCLVPRRRRPLQLQDAEWTHHRAAAPFGSGALATEASWLLKEWTEPSLLIPGGTVGGVALRG